MPKVMTLLGTRPEIIRLSRVIEVLDETCDHLLVHTGQNYDDRLSGMFFRELGVREPDVYMGVRGTGFADQIGQMLARAEELFAAEKPDTVLILGDTNTGIAAFVAKRMGIRVCHMEAGNRCYDDRVPEEVNRRVIDHSSSVLMPYTYRSAENLVREGIERERIFVTGNPIKEVLDFYSPQIDAADPFTAFDVLPDEYFLVTAHRAETTDDPARLASLVEALNSAVEQYGMPALASLHPRTADKMQQFGVAEGAVRFVPPMGLFDFVRLEKEAFCVLSDSGTVQEECCIFGVPTVTMRDVTERPETIECGSNILAGVEAERILPAIDLAVRSAGTWTPPAEYLARNVSDIVARIVLGIA
ncbi:MAG: UDP-N-acetylglucosamine 2-epimerase (non-hydrolyzing) [Actinobacteria bacterium HGW-Actinobacteria-1]|jgi:UDP-N-acetylglucosamine 2-epimerase (non-hydrolysing)|nr:MAG: UDP-N-acetylglucosamine 2-epimerase (non-hydrolyzing) [Actinobacteria bacterium HGW-Actinobacteria-1]